MRKITIETVGAFLRKEKRRMGNTESTGTELLLHGNLIAKHTDQGIMITLAGWPTPTTRERLNYIPNVWLNQSKGKQILNGSEWDGSLTLITGNRHN